MNAGEAIERRASLLRRWHPVGWAATLGTGPVATMLLGERIVLWREASGRAVAALDRCPHRGTALSLGEVDDDGRLVCPYHGWRYAGDGSCTEIPQLGSSMPAPGRARLTSVSCVERYRMLWVNFEDPTEQIPSFAEWDDPAYRHVPCPSYTWRTSPERMVENFTDFGHLGYLHDGLLGTRDDLVVPAHHVERRGDELHYEMTMEVPNTNAQFAVTDVRGRRGVQTNVYVLSLPYTIHLECRYHDTGAHRTLFFSVQPHGDGTCTGYCYQTRDFDLAGADEPYAAFQELLAEQDRPIVESQMPQEVPLRRQAELHLQFDRVAVAYRRAMAEFGEFDQRAERTSPEGTVTAMDREVAR